MQRKIDVDLRNWHAQGITGKLTLCDAKTGKPRTIIDIEKAAKLRTEDGRTALRRQKYHTAPKQTFQVERQPNDLPRSKMHVLGASDKSGR